MCAAAKAAEDAGGRPASRLTAAEETAGRPGGKPGIQTPLSVETVYVYIFHLYKHVNPACVSRLCVLTTNRRPERVLL